jgi:hypothetical protein
LTDLLAYKIFQFSAGSREEEEGGKEEEGGGKGRRGEMSRR